MGRLEINELPKLLHRPGLIAAGERNQGLQLLSMITPEAAKVTITQREYSCTISASHTFSGTKPNAGLVFARPSYHRSVTHLCSAHMWWGII